MLDLRLPINEVFQTIQGEARYTGTPSVFVRFQGCPVGCPWCDTRHTWEVDPALEIHPDDMLAKTADAPTYALMTAAELAEMIDGFEARHVVLTGGEPCLYDLTLLTRTIVALGKSVQIETSGTEPIRVDYGTWVTVSPKFGMPGGRQVLCEALLRADEIKMPVGKLADVLNVKELLESYPPESPLDPSDVWLQPLSQSPKATKLCIDMATTHGFKVSVQVHKFLGVR